MKSTSVLSVLALASVVASVPLQHHHNMHKRAPVYEYVTETVIVTAGAQGGVSTSISVGDATSTSAPEKESSTSSFSEATSTSSSEASSSSSSATSTESSTSSSTSSSSSSSSSSSDTSDISGDLSDFENPTEEFEDGTVSCSDFPSGQGVIALDWLDYNGWASIMDESGNTATSCEDGYYCSYACQAGMSKTQWPSSQPSSGISVGGLYCKDGYLYKSNSDSNYLCEWGADTAKAVSQLTDDVALCRTDYPGSESMVVPTLLSAGGSKPISVVNESTYYQWEGKETSAQYYVNNAGVSVEDGCIWGTSGSGVGNWAPVVLGAGYIDGITYLSLIPNPNNSDAPNYSVKITSATGTISGACSYVDGSFSGDSTDGCTASVPSGSTAKFVFY
ncbi:hypothetical protein PACTADRAFT_48789 [Pachysolen tannophilus NRRL Y-2460]|uniref:SUN domain-containing protein n=1 Tax=Pachysolen tannophilus NRRL Y-2460 TaxID=669874 RepID=A0A1E4TZ41_PACTA|nr:hypothetical protein PACTADRAFT_48789 [Pachysolen tannophilus NRRL Y-2460]